MNYYNNLLSVSTAYFSLVFDIKFLIICYCSNTVVLIKSEHSMFSDLHTVHLLRLKYWEDIVLTTVFLVMPLNTYTFM